MLEEMPSHVFTEWMAYYNIEPFGDEVIDHHMAHMTAILANQNRGKNQKAVKPEQLKLWKQIAKPFDAGEFYENLKGMLRKSR
jgi:hypothetical protein